MAREESKNEKPGSNDNGRAKLNEELSNNRHMHSIEKGFRAYLLRESKRVVAQGQQEEIDEALMPPPRRLKLASTIEPLLNLDVAASGRYPLVSTFQKSRASQFSPPEAVPQAHPPPPAPSAQRSDRSLPKRGSSKLNEVRCWMCHNCGMTELALQIKPMCPQCHHARCADCNDYFVDRDDRYKT